MFCWYILSVKRCGGKLLKDFESEHGFLVMLVMNFFSRFYSGLIHRNDSSKLFLC